MEAYAITGLAPSQHKLRSVYVHAPGLAFIQAGLGPMPLSDTRKQLGTH